MFSLSFSRKKQLSFVRVDDDELVEENTGFLVNLVADELYPPFLVTLGRDGLMRRTLFFSPFFLEPPPHGLPRAIQAEHLARSKTPGSPSISPAVLWPSFEQAWTVTRRAPYLGVKLLGGLYLCSAVFYNVAGIRSQHRNARARGRQHPYGPTFRQAE